MQAANRITDLIKPMRSLESGVVGLEDRLHSSRKQQSGLSEIIEEASILIYLAENLVLSACLMGSAGSYIERIAACKARAVSAKESAENRIAINKPASIADSAYFERVCIACIDGRREASGMALVGSTPASWVSFLLPSGIYYTLCITADARVGAAFGLRKVPSVWASYARRNLPNAIARLACEDEVGIKNRSRVRESCL